MLNLIRNIGIMAHIDAGKTTTTERILFYTGETYRIGEVDDGEAIMDFLEEEQRRGITIQSAATTAYWRRTRDQEAGEGKGEKFQINIIDTPGHVDFTGEVERSLRVLDGAIAIFDAVQGVEPQTETVWRQAEKYGVPCIGYVNKMDRLGADYFRVLKDIEAKLGAKTAALEIPIGAEGNFEGVIDLIDMREIRWDADTGGEKLIYAPIAPERSALAEEWREKLIDALSQVSEVVTDKYLAGEELEPDLIRRELRAAVLSRELFPTFVGASRRNMGVQPLIDAAVDYLPAPDETAPHIGFHLKKEEDAPVPCNPAGAPLGLVFKIVGNFSYVRMYSGAFKPGMAVYNVRKKIRERANRILRMHSNKSDPLDELSAGDIGVIIGLKSAQTGDTVGGEGWPVVLEKMQFPEPVISVSVESRTISEQDKLKESLATLSKEDPTFIFKDNEETGQMIISGMGELHLEVLVSRILKEYNLSVRVGKPQVTYRESVSKTLEWTESFSKTLAGKENAAELTLRVEPLPRGSGNRYVCLAKQPEVPEGIYQAVERGVTGAFNSGILQGYPYIDLGVTLLNLKYSELTGSAFAFEACASIGVGEACKQAEPIILEPIMLVEISSPKEYLGDVISAVIQRGGQVEGTESLSSTEIIKCTVPLAQMFGFMNVLRGVSQGRGNFNMEFSHFEKPSGR